MGQCFFMVEIISEPVRQQSGKTCCKVCKKEMKQIPIRKIDSLIVVEEYCPFCDESILRYEKILAIE